MIGVPCNIKVLTVDRVHPSMHAFGRPQIDVNEKEKKTIQHRTIIQTRTSVCQRCTVLQNEIIFYGKIYHRYQPTRFRDKSV